MAPPLNHNGTTGVVSYAAGLSEVVDGDLPLPTGLPAGVYYLGAIADDLNEVSEENEDNNTRVSDAGPVVGQ